MKGNEGEKHRRKVEQNGSATSLRVEELELDSKTKNEVNQEPNSGDEKVEHIVSLDRTPSLNNSIEKRILRKSTFENSLIEA